jgi:tRNA A37 methylthiotransferase MiaB
VNAVARPRSHDHEADADTTTEAAGAAAGAALTGRTREHKLVHLGGDPTLVGRLVSVRIEHAGPYALRGTLVGE